MDSTQRKIDKVLRDVETIHSFMYSLNDSDPRVNLNNARSRRNDAVRITVLQMSLSIEDLIDSLFWRTFAGHDPKSKKRKSKKQGIARELDELLTSGRMGFEAKVKLARIIGLINKNEQKKLDALRTLRNKCAHHWMLNIIRKRGTKGRPSKRLLEYQGRTLFDLKVLEDFMSVYSGIYLKLFDKYVA